MEKLEKAKIITKIVRHSIWLALGLFLYIGLGIYGFAQAPGIFSWFVWGIACTPFVIPEVIKIVKDMAKDGKKQGANEYTVRQSGNTYTVENHPLRGAIVGGIAGLIAGIFGGPIFLPLTAIIKIIELVKSIKILATTKD